MNPETIEVAKQAIESATSVKGIAIGAGTVGPLAIVSQSCGIDYTSPTIIFPLITSILTSIFVVIQIREIYLKKKLKEA